MDANHEWMPMDASHVPDNSHDYITQSYENPFKF